GVVWRAAYNGQAAQTLALIGVLGPDQQTKVLAAPGVVWALAYNGQAAQIIALIDRLNPNQQTAVLAMPDAVWALATNGQGDAVESMQHRVVQRLAARPAGRASGPPGSMP